MADPKKEVAGVGTEVEEAVLGVKENKVVLGDKEFAFPMAYKYEKWANENPDKLNGLTAEEFMIVMEMRTLEAGKGEDANDAGTAEYNRFRDELVKIHGSQYLLDLEHKAEKARIEWDEIKI